MGHIAHILLDLFLLFAFCLQLALNLNLYGKPIYLGKSHIVLLCENIPEWYINRIPDESEREYYNSQYFA
jgi:hypothetical protein